MFDFGYSLCTGKRVDILQGYVYITAQVVQKLPFIDTVDGRNFLKHLAVTYAGLSSAISIKVYSQIAHKIVD